MSLQDHSRAPKHIGWAHPERIKRMVNQIRQERERGKRAKYQYVLVSVQAIHYELRELHISPLPSSRTIHRWLKQTNRIPERRSQKPPNSTYPLLPCQASLSTHYDWRTRDLRLLKGNVTFLRLVRKSGRITLTVIWQGKHIKSFDYR